jgi:hypothetical protein
LTQDTPVWDLLQRIKSSRDLESWKRAGKPAPPPHGVKQRIISEYATSFRPDILIETGTFKGDMIYAMRNRFREIFSIELSKHYWEKAKRRFKNYPQIQLVQGDSAELLPRLLSAISKPCLFWLDGHYSADLTAKGALETPIIREMTAILDHSVKDHIVLVDDARCFDGSHDYPTVEKFREFVAKHRPDWSFTVAEDVIRIHSSRALSIEF